MIKKLPKENMGKSNLGWLQSRFHFSFAEYRNPKNINFGVLRVLNDDLVEAKTGFEMHPHENMEIISYIVDGEITHKDSMGNSETLKRGEVQYLSAGDGIYRRRSLERHHAAPRPDALAARIRDRRASGPRIGVRPRCACDPPGHQTSKHPRRSR